MTALIDMTGVAFADDIVKSIAIGLYFLSCEIAGHFEAFCVKNNNI
jgi:hypothetical protein